MLHHYKVSGYEVKQKLPAKLCATSPSRSAATFHRAAVHPPAVDTLETKWAEQVQQTNTVTPRRVVTCYDLLELSRQAGEGGFEDYTDGMYFGDPYLPYEVAQENQANYLLQEVDCRPGARILDIGCGNGRILEAAKRRRAQAVGITISPAQVVQCRRKNLTAWLMDYRQMHRHFPGQFDGLIANGSIEHFVQPEDAAAGRADAIYRKFFESCSRVLDQASGSKRLATTVIHFGRVRVPPEEALAHPLRFRWGSDAFHYSLLARSFGGYYPVAGQLAACAAPWFELEKEEDGTWDYWRTSEHWLSVEMRSLTSWRFQLLLLGKLLQYPIQASHMLVCLWIAQSWNWQFRGQDPPMRLKRQTWRLKAGSANRS